MVPFCCVLYFSMQKLDFTLWNNVNIRSKVKWTRGHYIFKLIKLELGQKWTLWAALHTTMSKENPCIQGEMYRNMSVGGPAATSLKTPHFLSKPAVMKFCWTIATQIIRLKQASCWGGLRGSYMDIVYFRDMNRNFYDLPLSLYKFFHHFLRISQTTSSFYIKTFHYEIT